MTPIDSQSGLHAAERQMRKAPEVAWHDIHTLTDWYPVDISDAPCTLWWRNLQHVRFTKSFFQDELRAQPLNERRLLQTPLTALAELSLPGRTVAPTAFIFHVSRCGSTLLTQMLAQSPHNIVMSEPPVVDAFLRYCHAHGDWPQAQHFFRLLIAALGQRRSDSEKYFFVKFDSWHVPWIPFVRQAFPDTPMVFLYRDPAEVLASHQRQRGPQMVPGLLNTSRLQPVATDVDAADLDGFCLRTLTAMMELAHGYVRTDKLLPLNYRLLPQVLWTDLVGHFGMEYSNCDIETLQARAQYHSKANTLAFTADASLGSQRLTRAQQTTLQSSQHAYQQLEECSLEKPSFFA